MRIVVDIGHPAHVHLFKNFVWEMERRGHELLATARNKETTSDLLDKLGIKYVKIGKSKKNNACEVVEIFRIDYKLYKIAKKIKPNVLIGATTNVDVTHMSKLQGDVNGFV
jgi:predicted glycosyltransferase